MDLRHAIGRHQGTALRASAARDDGAWPQVDPATRHANSQDGDERRPHEEQVPEPRRLVHHK
jgi:hypothetical protein